MSMYFTAVASLMPLQREIPLKLGSTARQCVLQSGALCSMYFTAVASLIEERIPLKKTIGE